jgi:nitrate/nitrite transporter NarK
MDNDHSIVGAVKNLGSDLAQIFKSELTLAKAELQDSISKMGKGAGLFGGAGLVGIFAAEFLLLALLFGLMALGLRAWLAALLVGVILLVAAGVLAMMGKKNVSDAAGAPSRTAERIKEDAATIKEDVKHVARR